MDWTHPFTWISGGAALATFLIWLDVHRGMRTIPDLSSLPADAAPGVPWEPVTIVVAARDEERGVEAGLRSLLASDHPDLRIVAVDDRSGDRTGEILDGLASSDARLTVVHVAELPPGWLGKCNAMHVGAARARDGLVVFTDGDVVLAPSTIRRAALRLRESGADHLTSLPDVSSRSFGVEWAVAVFAMFFTLFIRPWRVRDPKSRAHVGVGAFNMVRTEAYRRVGGHSKIALRPDDDVMLGRLLKQSGLRTEVVSGFGHVRVEWYPSLRELVRGLEKNMFAGIGYSVPAVLAATVVQLAFLTLPWWLAVAPPGGDGGVRALAASAVVFQCLLFVRTNWRRSGAMGTLVLLPFAAPFFLGLLWRSMILAYMRRGILWRGTLYPLAQLRANRL